MALKKPSAKIKSSFAMFEFASKELLYLRNGMDWMTFLKSIPEPTGRSVQDYHQLIEATRIAIFGYHLEILQESLREFRDTKIVQNLPAHHQDLLHHLWIYVFQLRCALLHAKGTLIPRWDIQIPKDPQSPRRIIINKLTTTGLNIKIPILEESKGVRFSEKSKKLMHLNFKIRLKKNIPINDNFIHRMRLVSWHIFTMTKKRSSKKLEEYIDKTMI